jgi:hypothetical protein
MECPECGEVDGIEGSLEGVSFLPRRRKRKLFQKAAYGLRAIMCEKCGRCLDMRLSEGALKAAILINDSGK